MMTTQYKYTVRSLRDDRYIGGSYSDFINGHFHWHSGIPGLAGAYLFDSASEAENKTRAGRENTCQMEWVIVPVKVTEVKTPDPQTYTTKTVRELA